MLVKLSILYEENKKMKIIVATNNLGKIKEIKDILNDYEVVSLKEAGIDIDVEEIHSLQNNGDIQLKILEVQQGDILDENDIVRLEDIYGRV